MTTFEFVKLYNAIKPTSSDLDRWKQDLSDNFRVERLREYELEITGHDIAQEEILIKGIVTGTNISALHFSALHFSSAWVIDDMGFYKFSYMEEKGEFMLGAKDKLVYFLDERSEFNELSLGMSENDFLDWYLGYLKLDFARAYKRDIPDLETLKKNLLNKYSGEILREAIEEVSI